MASLADGIAVTGAISGKVLGESTVKIQLTNAQKSQLASFITTLGIWPGQPANINSVHFDRQGGAPNNIIAEITGFIVTNDWAAAGTAYGNGSIQTLLGQVP